MTLIAKYRVPAEEFALGRTVESGMAVELERLVADGTTGVQYFWVDGGPDPAFGDTLEGTARIRDLELLDEVGSRALYRGTCPLDGDPLVRAVVNHDVTVLSAEGDDREWWFHLCVPDRTALSAFQSSLVDELDGGMDLEGVYNLSEAAPPFRGELTDRQRETLLLAYEEGYFDVPREITLVGLAELLGVSDQAVSERMRRATAKLVRSRLVDLEDDWTTPTA